MSRVRKKVHVGMYRSGNLVVAKNYIVTSDYSIDYLIKIVLDMVLLKCFMMNLLKIQCQCNTVRVFDMFRFPQRYDMYAL